MTVPDKAVLFTIDIDSFYTNNNTEMGLKAVKTSHSTDNNRPDDEIPRILKTCLTNNDFEFDGRFYGQVQGTAVGQRFALAHGCANIYMSRWERGLGKMLLKTSFLSHIL